LTENNRLSSENNKLAYMANDLNEQLITANERCNQRIQELMSAYQSNVDKFIKNNQETLVHLAEINSLNLIPEGVNLLKLKQNILLSESSQEQ
jgi:hypothetical protein